MCPQEFAEDPNAGEDQVWDILGTLYTSDPRKLLTPSDFQMIHLWRLSQDRILPDDGGAYGQAAIMWAAFAVLSNAEVEIKAEREQLLKSMGALGH